MEKEFETTVCCVPCNIPYLWCTSCLFPCCTLYKQRKYLLNNDMNKYICCNGIFPCTSCECVKECPGLCLTCEMCICPGCAASTNRNMMMNLYNISENAKDTCLFCINNICQCAMCLCGSQTAECVRNIPIIGSDISNVLDCCGSIIGTNDENITKLFADCFFCCICTCMLAQTENEIMQIKENNPFNVPTNIYAIPAIYPNQSQFQPAIQPFQYCLSQNQNKS